MAPGDQAEPPVLELAQVLERGEFFEVPPLPLDEAMQWRATAASR